MSQLTQVNRDFTIECWDYQPKEGWTGIVRLVKHKDPNMEVNITLLDKTIRFHLCESTGFSCNLQFKITSDIAGRESHYALVRIGNLFQLYVNGVLNDTNDLTVIPA